MMRFFHTIGLMLLLCCLSLAQVFRGPAKGETVMKIVIENKGDIIVHLYTSTAPKTTAHIIDLVEKKFYDGQRFHRVEKVPRPFIALVGDPATKTKSVDDPGVGSGGSGARIPYEETNTHHVKGSVSLAALPKDRDSGDSQFFFSLEASKFLDGKHTIFGRVTYGLDVMDSIEKGDKITSVTILRG